MLREESLFEDVSLPCAAPENSLPLTIDCHGSEVYGRILLPARVCADETAPVALMLHGYPGWETLPDVHHALRRAGIAVAYFNFRGVWGSHGTYSFTHLIEDAACVLQQLRDHAGEYHIDPEHIYLIGYSMGGFTALHTIANGENVRGVVLVSPCDIGEIYFSDKATYEMLMSRQSLGCFHLSAPDILSRETEKNAKAWRFLAVLDRIPVEMPIHFIGATLDETTPPPLNIHPLYNALLQRGQPTSYVETADKHSYNTHRIWLTRQIFRCIKDMES